jgi:hypothetical protein
MLALTLLPPPSYAWCMMTAASSRSRQAWNLAHKILSLTRIVPEREGADLLEVSTAQICKAMGQPNGAKLEEVRDFVLQVVEFMQGYDAHLVCGCGYLSLLVSREELARRYFDEGREPTRFKPLDLDQYFDEHVINAPRSDAPAPPEVCARD